MWHAGDAWRAGFFETFSLNHPREAGGLGKRRALFPGRPFPFLKGLARPGPTVYTYVVTQGAV